MLRRAAIALALVVGAAVAARAETLVEKVNETRTYLYFKVADTLARELLAASRRPCRTAPPGVPTWSWS
jgi:hypothetical protein